MLKIVKLTDKGFKMDAELEGKKAEPYLTALVEEREREGDSEFASFKVLKVLDSDERNLSFGDVPQFGDYTSCPRDMVEPVRDEREFSPKELAAAQRMLESFDSYHKNAPYLITGRFYEEISEDKDERFRVPEKLEERQFRLPKEINSPEKAELWLLEKHPDYYMGAGIVQDCRGSNMSFLAVPSVEYGKGSFEKWDDRRQYCRERHEDLYEKIKEKSLFKGELGPKEHDEKGRFLEERQPEKELPEMQKDRFVESREEKDLPELSLDKDYFIIWQRDENDEMAFRDYGDIKELGQDILRDDFEPVYIGPYEKTITLDEIYDRFQKDLPDGMERELSIGDVITVNNNRREDSFFVDEVGFEKIDEFTKDFEIQKERDRFLVSGIIHDRPAFTRLETSILEDHYNMDLDGNEKIGINGLESDVRDRDLSGSGKADRYDRDDEDDPHLVR